MRIGEVANRVTVNPRTIRYYESIGLIPKAPRTDAGYRDFGERDCDRIRFIKAARRLDLSLDEIGEIMSISENEGPPCGHVREIVRARKQELEEQIAEMIQLRERLAEIERSATPGHNFTGHVFCPLITSQDAEQARTR